MHLYSGTTVFLLFYAIKSLLENHLAACSYHFMIILTLAQLILLRALTLIRYSGPMLLKVVLGTFIVSYIMVAKLDPVVLPINRKELIKLH